MPLPPSTRAKTAHAIRTPRAAAVAGIVFSILFTTCVILAEWSIPAGSDDPQIWISEPGRRDAMALSLQLLPFAGIAFLWFVGVLRDRIGAGEDRFFATVFLGSGLLFVAMFFVSGALTGGLVSVAADPQATEQLASVWPFASRSASSLAAVYGLRMAAVFTISATTLATRLGLVPRWLAILGYTTGVVLLLVGILSVPWLRLLFPAWVLALSIHILVSSFRSPVTSALTPEQSPEWANVVNGDTTS